MSYLKRRVGKIVFHGALLVALSVFSTVAFLSHDSNPASAQARPQGSDKLRIALSMTPQNGLLFIAEARGTFAKHGLKVTPVPVAHGKAGLELLTKGEADLTMAAETPTVIAIMNGEALSFALNILAVNGHAVIARRDRGIAKVADLVGKRIGVSFGTSGEYYLWALLVRHKIAPDSVILVDLLPAELAPALARGTIDAAATWPPFVYDAQKSLNGSASTFTDPDVYTQGMVLVGRSTYLKEHRRAIEKLTRALLEAEQFAHQKPDEALAIVARYLKRDIDILRPVWKIQTFRVNLLQSHLVTLEHEARWAMARGYAVKGPVPNFLDNLYLDALLAVDPKRVTVVR